MRFTLYYSIALGVGTAVCVQAASTIEFTAASYDFAESVGFAPVTVQRLTDPSTTASVDYATADGTATNGLKYTAVSGTLAFGAGETNKTILVPILNNGLVDGTKTFQVLLRVETGQKRGHILQFNNCLTCFIWDWLCAVSLQPLFISDEHAI